MIAFEDYARIRANYCVAYLGPDPEIVRDLLGARDVIEAALPVRIHLCCRDEIAPEADRVIPVSRLKAERPKLAHIREVGSVPGGESPAQTLLRECGVRSGKTT